MKTADYIMLSVLGLGAVGAGVYFLRSKTAPAAVTYYAPPGGSQAYSPPVAQPPATGAGGIGGSGVSFRDLLDVVKTGADIYAQFQDA